MIELNLGPEQEFSEQRTPKKSRHLVNLKDTDALKKQEARADVSLDLRQEIRSKHQSAPGRICIVGEQSRERQGLGRVPMVLGALFMIFALNLGQLYFLGRTQGEEALALASEAMVSLQGAGESFLSGEPGSESFFFSEAEALFAEAEEKSSFLLNQNSPWLSEPARVHSLRNLLDAGELMAEVGTLMSNAHVALLNMPEEGSLTEYIDGVSLDYIEPAAERMSEILTLLSDVDLSGTGYAQQFGDYYEKLEDLTKIFALWIDIKEPLLTALGDEHPQDYLVLLMNNNELRLGGGFIGSIAHIQLNDGRISRFDFQDVYELDNRYFDLVEVPTPELQGFLPEGSWRLRDSNVFPDFPTTAEQAMWFYDEEGGDGVDGVIAVNLSSVQDLMDSVGPVEVPSLGRELTADEFPLVMSTLVEAKIFGETSPKVILGEFIDSFVEELKTVENKPALGAELLDQMQSKNIMLYHSQDKVQSLFEDFGLSASMPKLSEVEGDYLFTTFTNVGANKTDQYMETGIAHETHIFGDGSVVNALSIARSHTFTEETLTALKATLAGYGFTEWDGKLEEIMGKDVNETGIRIYLPEGVEILEVTGDAHRHDFQIYYDTELEASYYYIEQAVQPGAMQRFTILYGLSTPFLGEFPEYEFSMFTQPGLRNAQYRKHVSAPDDILLSSDPLPTDEEEGFDYTRRGELEEFHLKLLYR